MSDTFLLDLYKGEEREFITPHGKTLTIRDRNALDDDCLGNPKYITNNTSLRHFTTRIVTEVERVPVNLKLSDISHWSDGEIYYIFLQSRIHTNGSEYVFPHICSNSECHLSKNRLETHYDVNLNNYTIEASTDPDINSEAEYKFKSLPKPADDGYIKFTLNLKNKDGSPNDIQFRLRYQDEQSTVKLSRLIEKSVLLDIYVARGLECQRPDGAWIPLSRPDLAHFPASLNTIAFKTIMEYDPTPYLLTNITCVSCGVVEVITLFNIKDFLYPALA